MSGVELDLACAESDADDFSSSAKSKNVRHVSIEEDQRFTHANGADDDDDDDDIAIIEPTTTTSTSTGTRQAQITIENDLSSAMDTTTSKNTKNDSHENGKRRRPSRAPSSSSSTGASRSSSSSSSSSSNSRASNRRSTHDSNDDVMDNDSSCIFIKSSRTTVRQTKSFTDVEQRKASGMPTLMITVKNEMAQPVDEQTIPSADPAETATLRHIFSDAVYYLIKSGNEENIALAKSKGVWSTPPLNENKLNRAFQEHRNVILIFSVAESKAFQGFARMSGEARHDSQPVNWILPPGMSNRAFSGVIHIDWVTRRSLPFNKTSHLFNSWNENKPVKIGRDGQEIEPRCAEALCRLFPSDSAVDIMSIAMKAKRNKKRYSSRSQSRSPLAVDVPRASSPANSSPPSSPAPPPPPTSSTLVVKRQISKDRSRRSPPADKHRPSSSSNITSRHSSTRPHHHYHHHRSPSANDRHRRQKSRSREREDKDVQRKRRRRSGSSRSDHGGKIAPNRKHSHRGNGDQPSYGTNNKTMAKIISNGTYEEYMNHLFASHVQYAGFSGGMFPPGGYPMGYDANGMYPVGYDQRGLPLPMSGGSGGGGYNASTGMYFPSSSRSRNPAEYDHEINTFLRHTTTSGMYMPGDMALKSHRSQRYHRTDTDYRHKTTTRHRSKSREHRR